MPPALQGPRSALGTGNFGAPLVPTEAAQGLETPVMC